MKKENRADKELWENGYNAGKLTESSRCRTLINIRIGKIKEEPTISIAQMKYAILQLEELKNIIAKY